MASQKTFLQAWDRLAAERVQEPLHPERLRTLLLIVPAASGDVALATTLVRHVKQINPDCRITFATRRPNIALAQMCPGVHDTLELPHTPLRHDMHDAQSLRRRHHLAAYAGAADAVLYPCPFPEDIDLLTEYGFNSLEAFWLLAGVPKKMLPLPPQVWLETPLAPSQASAIIGRCLQPRAQARLLVRGGRRIPESLAAVVRLRSLQGSGLRVIFRDLTGLINTREIARPIHKKRLAEAALERDFVVLSTEAVSLPPPPPGVISALVTLLRADGRTVLHNVRDPLRAAAGTVPLVCSYAEFLCLRAAGVPFVGWRSGLCDVAAASPAPLCVLCPPQHDWCKDIQATHGLRSMGTAPHCLEIVCRDGVSLKTAAIIDYLHQDIFDKETKE